MMMLALISVTSFAGEVSPFHAQGNEPSWSLRLTDDTITFHPMEGDPVILRPVPSPHIDGEARVYQPKAGKARFTLRIEDKICTDTMTGMPFPSSVSVTTERGQLNGCGGEPMKLLQGKWLITTIDGKPVVQGSSPNVVFEADGKLSGNGSCNQFSGGYVLSGEGLTIGSIGASMMMCEDFLMEQEQLLLGVMKDVTGFEVPEKHQLLLRTHDGRKIHARQAD